LVWAQEEIPKEIEPKKIKNCFINSCFSWVYFILDEKEILFLRHF
jgi:hypothetical protein